MRFDDLNPNFTASCSFLPTTILHIHARIFDPIDFLTTITIRQTASSFYIYTVPLAMNSAEDTTSLSKLKGYPDSRPIRDTMETCLLTWPHLVTLCCPANRVWWACCSSLMQWMRWDRLKLLLWIRMSGMLTQPQFKEAFTSDDPRLADDLNCIKVQMTGCSSPVSPYTPLKYFCSWSFISCPWEYGTYQVQEGHNYTFNACFTSRPGKGPH